MGYSLSKAKLWLQNSELAWQKGIPLSPSSVIPTLYLLKSWLLLWCTDIYFFKRFIWPWPRVWHRRLHHFSLCCGLKGCCCNFRWICYKRVIDCVVTLVRKNDKKPTWHLKLRDQNWKHEIHRDLHGSHVIWQQQQNLFHY